MISKDQSEMLRFLRVAELRKLLSTFRLTRSGKRQDLLRRLEQLFSNPVLVQQCGGTKFVEDRIACHYNCIKGLPKITKHGGATCDPEPLRTGKNRMAAGNASMYSTPTSLTVNFRDLNGNDAVIWARVLASDPFWAPIEELNQPGASGMILPPTRLTLRPGTHLQVLDRPFHLNSLQMNLLCSDSDRYQLQIACVLLDDPVQTRLHWPFLANVKVNGRPRAVMYRQPGRSIGKAGRDPPVSLEAGCVVEGTNNLSVQGQDHRSFCVIIRMVKLRSLREVRDMVPTPVPFPLARSLLEQTSCGGHDQKDQDDDVIIQDKSVISLRCPISGQICRIPVRTRHCKSPAVFDLDTFLELNSKVRKWICPHCGATAQPHEIIIDGFLSRIMGVIRAWEQANPTVASNIDRIEISPTGCWRVVCPVAGTLPETWFSSEALSGVVLSQSGLILHVPPKLTNTVGNGCYIADHAVLLPGSTNLGKEFIDQKLTAGHVIESDKVTQPSHDEREPNQCEISEVAVLDDVIVISDSDDDQDDSKNSHVVATTMPLVSTTNTSLQYLQDHSFGTATKCDFGEDRMPGVAPPLDSLQAALAAVGEQRLLYDLDKGNVKTGSNTSCARVCRIRQSSFHPGKAAHATKFDYRDTSRLLKTPSGTFDKSCMLSHDAEKPAKKTTDSVGTTANLNQLDVSDRQQPDQLLSSRPALMFRFRRPQYSQYVAKGAQDNSDNVGGTLT